MAFCIAVPCFSKWIKFRNFSFPPFLRLRSGWQRWKNFFHSQYSTLGFHISHLTCWGSYIINFTILWFHDFTILRFYDFTISPIHDSLIHNSQFTNSQFIIHSWHLALLQIKNSLADTRESYIEVYHRKN